MWTYILRRLLVMIPTLVGVTIVSFCIMQLAPGDPLLAQAGPGGMAGQSLQTREAYLIQKRDLKLDKPLLINLRGFRDYSATARGIAYFFSLSRDELRAALSELAGGDDPQTVERRAFLRRLGIDQFDARLADPQQYPRLAEAIANHLLVYCEDLGRYAVPALIELLESPDTSPAMRIGAIRGLSRMVVEPFVYTYSREPRDVETAQVQATWQVWWERNQQRFEPVPAERAAQVRQRIAEMSDESTRADLFEQLEAFDQGDMPVFVEVLLDDDSTLSEKVVAALGLRLFVGQPLRVDVPLGADAALVDDIARNWQLHFAARESEYQPSWPLRLARVISDTQYAHMIWRLATFNFGRSALRTREPVAERIWRAFLVSAPLMLLAQALIYVVSIPLGVICAVNRGGWIDRLISFKLFVLYSVPPFVAGMLFLLLFCYGDYFKWFPMQGLHSEGAESLPLIPYLLDYLWHIVLPVTCLSLFSLAVVAMYARTSMLDVIGQDYIRTARAKGVPERRVITRHALRNALIPIVTLFANFLPAMLGGSVIIEVLFGIPGLGRLSWASIEQKDFPTLMALIYIDAIVVMASILLTDLLYVLIDPRIGFDRQEAGT